jgi:hypothetical protein
VVFEQISELRERVNEMFNLLGEGVEWMGSLLEVEVVLFATSWVQRAVIIISK